MWATIEKLRMYLGSIMEEGYGMQEAGMQAQFASVATPIDVASVRRERTRRDLANHSNYRESAAVARRSAMRRAR